MNVLRLAKENISSKKLKFQLQDHCLFKLFLHLQLKIHSIPKIAKLRAPLNLETRKTRKNKRNSKLEIFLLLLQAMSHEVKHKKKLQLIPGGVQLFWILFFHYFQIRSIIQGRKRRKLEKLPKKTNMWHSDYALTAVIIPVNDFLQQSVVLVNLLC